MDWLRKLLDRFTPETYVENVNIMEGHGMTYLPNINGKYGPRAFDERDVKGRPALAKRIGWPHHV